MKDFTVDALEAATLAEQTTGKRWRAVLVRPGWGTTGYYSAEVLQRDGVKIFKEGLPIFLDHQTADEKASKPFGSVQNFAGVLATDAVWDAEEQALVAEVEIFEHEQGRVRALSKHVGLSLRSTVRAVRGDMDGRSGRIITAMESAKSVDLVVRAGAGGHLLEALESEAAAELEKEETENMDEVLEALRGLSGKLDDQAERLTALESAVEKDAQAEESATVVEDALTVDDVRSLANSGLSEAAVDSVLDKRKGSTKSLSELIEAEKQYISAQESAAESEATVDEEEEEAEESASDDYKVPAFWTTK